MPRTTDILYISPKRGLRHAEAAHYVGVSTSQFDRWIAEDLMPAGTLVGGVRLWDIRAIDACLDNIFNPAPANSNKWNGRCRDKIRQGMGT